MFEKFRWKIMEQLVSLPLNDQADRLQHVGELLQSLDDRTPEESVFIPLNDFTDVPDEKVFNIRFDVLARMATMRDGPLESLLFLRDADNAVHLIARNDHMRVLDDQPIAHPVTGEIIENPAKRTYLGYTLRPQFMLDKMRKHHNAGMGAQSPSLLIIAPDTDICQRIGLLGVPTMTVPFDELSHPDEARAAFWTLLEKRTTLIATSDALPLGTVVPENTVITLFPGIPDGPVRDAALAAQARLTRPVRHSAPDIG